MNVVMKMNQSYWQKTSKKKIEKTVQTDISTDIVIIGGGLSGVSLAYQLKDSPYQIIVLDKDEMGSHASGHTTAKITTLHSTLYYDIAKHYDIHQAYLYYQSNEQALNEIKAIIQKENIACDFQENQSFIYTDNPANVPVIQKQKELFHSFRVKTIESSHYLASLGLEHQAVFHPLKYLYSLIQICQKKNVVFYEHSQVIQIQRKDNAFILEVNGHQIRCLYLIHATRYPFIKKGMYFFKMFQERECVDCLEGQDSSDSYLCIDESKSYRPISKDYHLSIHDHAKDWYTQDTITLRGIPYIGRLNQNSQEFIIYGFQKWGMTLSQVAAKLISDLILEKDNPYEELYDCHYFSLSFSKKYRDQFFKQIYRGMITNRLTNHDLSQLENQDGIVTRIHGSLVAVYKDKKGNYHNLSPYCPHMRCIVEFDKKSQIWRCPCHQSVFDAYGRLLEGPSLESLKEKHQ